MKEYSADNGLELLSISGICLPSHETELFKEEFNKIYIPSDESFDFVRTIWKIYSEILPYQAYPDQGQFNSLLCISRDKKFQSKVIDSGIADKLKFVSLNDLVKDPHF